MSRINIKDNENLIIHENTHVEARLVAACRLNVRLMLSTLPICFGPCFGLLLMLYMMFSWSTFIVYCPALVCLAHGGGGYSVLR